MEKIPNKYINAKNAAILYVLLASYLAGSAALDTINDLKNPLQARFDDAFSQLTDSGVFEDEQMMQIFQNGYDLGVIMRSSQFQESDIPPHLTIYSQILKDIQSAIVLGTPIELNTHYAELVDRDQGLYALTFGYMAAFWGIDRDTDLGRFIAGASAAIRSLNSQEFIEECGNFASACASDTEIYVPEDQSIDPNILHEIFHLIEIFFYRNYKGVVITESNDVLIGVDFGYYPNQYVWFTDGANHEDSQVPVQSIIGAGEALAELWRMINERGMNLDLLFLKNDSYLYGSPIVAHVPELVEAFARDFNLRNEFINAYRNHEVLTILRIIGRTLLEINPNYVEDFYQLVSDPNYLIVNEVLNPLVNNRDLLDRIGDQYLVAGILEMSMLSAQVVDLWVERPMDNSWGNIARLQPTMDQTPGELSNLIAQGGMPSIVWNSVFADIAKNFIDGIDLTNYEPNPDVDKLILDFVANGLPSTLEGYELQAAQSIVYELVELLPEDSRWREALYDKARNVVLYNSLIEDTAYMGVGYTFLLGGDRRDYIDIKSSTWVSQLVSVLVDGVATDPENSSFRTNHILSVNKNGDDEVEVVVLNTDDLVSQFNITTINISNEVSSTVNTLPGPRVILHHLFLEGILRQLKGENGADPSNLSDVVDFMSFDVTSGEVDENQRRLNQNLIEALRNRDSLEFFRVLQEIVVLSGLEIPQQIVDNAPLPDLVRFDENFINQPQISLLLNAIYFLKSEINFFFDGLEVAYPKLFQVTPDALRFNSITLFEFISRFEEIFNDPNITQLQRDELRITLFNIFTNFWAQG